MLVRLTTNKGDVWVNPMHVRLIRPRKNGADVLMTQTWILKVEHSPEDTAALVSAAMPNIAAVFPDDDDQAASDAAVNAALMG